VISLLPLLSGDAGAIARWQLGLRGVHLLLIDLGLEAEARRTTVERLRKAHRRTFQITPNQPFVTQIGERFRREREALGRALVDEWPAEHPLAAGFEVLKRRSDALAPLAERLRSVAQAGQLSRPLDDVASSLLHMFTNRLFRSAAVPQEFVVYELLGRHYESEAARARSSRK
jgi:lantibiotic biosynthesis protein